MAARDTHKWSISPSFFAARYNVKHFKAFSQVGRVTPSATYMLCGTHYAIVSRVDVHFAIIRDVPSHAGSLEHV